MDTISAFTREPGTSLELVAARSFNSVYRDKETGSWWQQHSGKAIAGDLAGLSLNIVASERLLFGHWREQNPDGLIMLPEPDYIAAYNHWFPKLWP